jgi:hypothetical protein
MALDMKNLEGDGGSVQAEGGLIVGPLSESTVPLGAGTIRQPKVYFEPMDDITAWELAKAQGPLIILGQGRIYEGEQAIKQQPESVRRHFRIEG